MHHFTFRSGRFAALLVGLALGLLAASAQASNAPLSPTPDPITLSCLTDNTSLLTIVWGPGPYGESTIVSSFFPAIVFPPATYAVPTTTTHVVPNGFAATSNLFRLNNDPVDNVNGDNQAHGTVFGQTCPFEEQAVVVPLDCQNGTFTVDLQDIPPLTGSTLQSVTINAISGSVTTQIDQILGSFFNQIPIPSTFGPYTIPPNTDSIQVVAVNNVSEELVSITVSASCTCEPYEVDFSVDEDGNPLLAGAEPRRRLRALGIRRITAANNNGNHPDLALVFDSSLPTGGDPDLGTPNADFNGPGVGVGGQAGAAGENANALGNLVIIAENDQDLNNDGLVDVPDDEAAGGRLDFRFDGSATVESLTIVDIDDGATGAEVVTIFHDSGTSRIRTPLLSLGDNSVQTVDLGLETGVKKLRVKFPGSGGVATIRFCIDEE